MLPCNSSVFKKKFIASSMKFETGTCKMLQGSSWILHCKQVLQVIVFLTWVLIASRACGERLHRSSKIHERTSHASCCQKMLKSILPDLIITCFKKHKNCEGSMGDLEVFNRDIILRKADTKVVWLFELESKLDQNSGMTLKH